MYECVCTGLIGKHNDKSSKSYIGQSGISLISHRFLITLRKEKIMHMNDKVFAYHLGSFHLLDTSENPDRREKYYQL